MLLNISHFTLNTGKDTHIYKYTKEAGISLKTMISDKIFCCCLIALQNVYICNLIRGLNVYDHTMDSSRLRLKRCTKNIVSMVIFFKNFGLDWIIFLSFWGFSCLAYMCHVYVITSRLSLHAMYWRTNAEICRNTCFARCI